MDAAKGPTEWARPESGDWERGSAQRLPKQQLPALTSIRFFLAFWVVLFHSIAAIGGQAFANALPGAALNMIDTGYVAVGVFFVLSGFVLAYNYPLGAPWSKQETAKFAIARFSRIYPAYCLGLILAAPVIFFGQHGVIHRLSAPVLGKEAVKAFLNWSLLQAWVPQAALTWNPPGWSLSDEAFFYLCFPLLGYLLWRVTGLKRTAAVFAFLLAVMLIAPLTAALAGHGGGMAASEPPANDYWVAFVKFNPVLRIGEFCAGILMCRAYQSLRQANHYLVGRGFLLYLPGFAAMALILSRSNAIPYLFVHNGGLLPFYCSIVLGLALGGGSLAALLSNGVLVFLGNASYSMYILHALISGWTQIAANRILHYPLSGIGWLTAYLVVVVVASCVVFKYVEEPLHRILKRRLTLRLIRPVSAGAGAS